MCQVILTKQLTLHKLVKKTAAQWLVRKAAPSVRPSLENRTLSTGSVDVSVKILQRLLIKFYTVISSDCKVIVRLFRAGAPPRGWPRSAIHPEPTTGRFP